MTGIDAASTVRRALTGLRVSDDLVSHMRYVDDHVRLFLSSKRVAENRQHYATWMSRLRADGVLDRGWDIDRTIMEPGESSGTVFVTLAFVEPRPEGPVTYHRQSRFVVRSGRIIEARLDLAGVPDPGREYSADDR